MTLKCLAAHHNLIFDTDGHARLCCNSTETLILDGSIEQALTSHHARSIQQDLVNGIRNKNCDLCWREESHGDRSYRHSYNDMYPEFDLKPTLKTAHVQWDNTCNLTCVYCGPKFSSSWTALTNQRLAFRNPLQFDESTLSGLKMITLAGGEPSLIKSNQALLQNLHRINPDCEVIVNTNLTQSLDTPVFAELFKFENSTVIASFETTGARFEYIRRGADWNSFERNFIAIRDRVKKLQTNMIFFPLSAGTIEQTIDWTLEHISPNEIYLNDYTGDLLTWDKVGKRQLDNLVKKILQYSNSLPSRLKDELESKCQQMDSSLDQTNIEFLQRFDLLTNQDHRSIFTELYQ